MLNIFIITSTSFITVFFRFKSSCIRANCALSNSALGSVPAVYKYWNICYTYENIIKKTFSYRSCWVNQFPSLTCEHSSHLLLLNPMIPMALATSILAFCLCAGAKLDLFLPIFWPGN